MEEIEKLELERTMGLIGSLGLFALKMLLTLNSGATVVLLALLGGVIKESAQFPVHVPQLQGAMLLFLAGLSFAAVAIAVTYVLAQLRIMWWPKPPVRNEVHLALMVIPALLSFLCFAIGFVRATYAFG